MLDVWTVEEGDVLERMPDGRQAKFVDFEEHYYKLPCGCCFEFGGYEVEVEWLDTGETEWGDAEDFRLLES